MSHETFEDRLRRQPWRPLPESWRAEILERGAQAAASRAPALPHQPSRWRLFMEYLLWPSPRAWAGVTAIWLTALMANLVPGWTTSTPGTAQPVAVTKPGETLPQRQRILAEWLKLDEPGAPPLSPPATPPRGEGRITNRMG